MKSNFKRLLGLLLTVMMIVTMVPVTAFADVSTSAKFTVDGKGYILMDASTEIGGKTYYGVLSTDYVSREWAHARPKYTIESGSLSAGGNVEVSISLFDDRQPLSSWNPQLQSYTNLFTAFDGYMADTYRWDMYNSTPTNTNKKTLIYFRGPVGIPTTSMLKKIKENDALPIAAGDNGIMARELGFWSTYYYFVNLKPDNTTANQGVGGDLSNAQGGACWYLMTYVSEDFFTENKIDVDSNLGGKVKTFFTNNFPKDNMLTSNLYTSDELKTLGYTITADDLKVTGIRLNKKTTQVAIDNSIKLKAYVLPAYAENQSVKWTSADTTIATVDGGVVTGIKEGKTTIRATSAEDASIYAECEVEVVVIHADSVELDKETIEIYKGHTEELTATVKPDLAYNKEVIWSSSDDSVATVKDGVVKGIAPGNATITVTTVDGGKTDTCEVKIKDTNVTGVKLDKNALTVYVGDKDELKAIVSPDVAEVKAVKWSSDNEEVATVVGGVVEGIGEGTANITATTVDGGYIDICVVSVKTKDVTSVKLDQKLLDLNVRETKTLTATVEPSVALNKNIVWTSSNEEVATVKDGVVTGVNPGIAVIKAASAENENVYAICNVAVYKVPVTSIELNNTAMAGIVGTAIKLKATVKPDNATVLDVIWTSSDEKVATVVDGIVTPVSSGKVTIKATSADDETKFAKCEINVVRGPIDSPNYLKLENGVELLFNEVKNVGSETYFSFTIAKDYAGSATTRGLYWLKDTVDPLGNALDGSQYGEYYYQAGTEYSRTDTTLDTMEYGLPEGIKKNLLLNTWSTGFQYPLNGSGNGMAKSKTYFCIPDITEMRKHAVYISNLINDNTCQEVKTAKEVVIIRNGGNWEHILYSLPANTTISAGQGLAYLGGSVFPTFYVNVKAFGEVKFDLDTVGTDVKSAIMSNVPRSVIKQAGYDATALVRFGYVDDVLEITSSTVVGNSADINWKYTNKDTVPVNSPIIMAVAYDANNKMIKAVPVFPANPAAKIASNASVKGNVVVNTTEAPASIMLYVLKNSTVNPYPLADAVVVSGAAPAYTGNYSAAAVDLAINANAEFSINGTITSNSNAIVILTKPGKSVADLGTSNIEDVILNIAQVKANANGKYGYAFTEDKANLEYLKYTAGIYSATVTGTDSAIFQDSGFDATVKSVYSSSTLDEFVAVYGDTLDVDSAQLALLTPEQKVAVKAAVNVGGLSAEAIGTAINNKAKEIFVNDTRADLKTLDLAAFADKYASKLDGLDAGLASSVNATQEANVKASVVIDADDTPKEIADKINKELAAQVVSKATTVAQVVKALADYNKHLGLDLENWIDKKVDDKDVLTAAGKDTVYTIVANGTYADADELRIAYEKAVLITRINNAATPVEIQLVLKEYADANGEIYGVDVDEFETLSNTDFAGSLDQTYTDWADFVTTFNANVITYTPNGGSSGGSGGGGGGFGGGSGGTTLVQFTPEVDKELVNTTPKYMFADLGQAEWAVTYVEALAKLGHINGKGNNTFCPNDSIKREEVVKILVSALGLDVSATEASFTDVDAGAWYAPYIAAAKANGIVNGKPDGSFGIGAEITREELATMIYRAAGLLASETDVEFADEAEIADYAKEAVSTLVATGVLNGKGDNKFAPKANATRAEASKIIYLAVIGK